MSRVFISYAKEDSRHMKELSKRLRTLDEDYTVDIFIDKSIEIGMDWYKEIYEHLDKSDIAIFLMSENFLKSAWAPRELERTLLDQSTTAIPLSLTDYNWNQKYPELTRRQTSTSALEEAEKNGDPEAVWTEWLRCISDALKKTSREGAASRVTKPEPEDVVKEGVENGTFTPLLGPCCFEMRDNRDRALHFLGRRFHRLLLHPELKNDEEIKDYASSIVNANHPNVAAQGYVAPKSKPDEWSTALTSFQVSLAYSGLEACRLFGSALARNPVCLTGLRTADVSLLAGEQVQGGWHDKEDREKRALGSLDALEDWLVQAVGRVEELLKIRKKLRKNQDSRFKSSAKLLGVPAIRTQLEATTWSILGPLLKGNADWIAEYPEPDHIDTSVPKLSTVHLEWLSDLLWYTIRFDAPMYPTDYELAFQLSFTSDTEQQSRRPHREPLGIVGRVATTKTGIETIRDYFKHYAKGSASDSEFYMAMARALCHCLKKDPHELPIAISTNFDNDLESIFRTVNHPFSTLIPIKIEHGSGKTQKTQPYWLLCVEDSKESKKHWQLVQSGTKVNDLLEVTKGPLIVRLHGAPMVTLPPVSEIDCSEIKRKGLPTGSKPIHRLILWEYDILNWLVDTSSWPSALRKLLEDRALFFLGYRLRLADNRLKIFDQARPGPKDDEPDKRPPIYLIDQRIDSNLKAYLKRPNIDPIESTPSKFVEMILEIEDLYDFPARTA